MNQLQKYTWVIETIRRAGKISHKDLSEKWERCKDLSDYKPLPRATFNRWREAIYEQFSIDIQCQKVGGYLYYIANPENIDDDKLKKWMLDSFAVGNIIGENLSLKSRILVDEIPSGRDYLTMILEAMQENRVLNMAYKSFKNDRAYCCLVEPFCIKLHENRWYMLGHNLSRNTVRLYGLDRIESLQITDNSFKLPEDFDPKSYFTNYFGIVPDQSVKPEKIVLRAHKNHKYYLQSLPLHHSQLMIEDCGEYADFELKLAPTYDFVMKLLQVGSWIEVIEPTHLRKTMMGWIKDMYELYQND